MVSIKYSIPLPSSAKSDNELFAVFAMQQIDCAVMVLSISTENPLPSRYQIPGLVEHATAITLPFGPPVPTVTRSPAGAPNPPAPEPGKSKIKTELSWAVFVLMHITPGPEIVVKGAIYVSGV